MGTHRKRGGAAGLRLMEQPRSSRRGRGARLDTIAGPNARATGRRTLVVAPSLRVVERAIRWVEGYLRSRS